ncbi:MAG: cell wall hydrolase [Dethiobacteria bacterium]|jgi:N-acetylmuramoyl-L-alanine amidase
MIKNKLLVCLVCIVLLFGNNAVDAAAHHQHRSKEGLVLAHRGNDRSKIAKTELETGNGEGEERVALTPGEIELLARLVHAEAEGEPFWGKVGVAATVLNRLENAGYPDTVREIIYQQNHGFQYCPVRNGRINLPADHISLQAVRRAVEGRDPTGGALSFYNPAKSGNSWIGTRPYCRQIGNHIFVR